MWEWISTWTFFNWLTLIAFIFASISVTNAFFSLKSRFKDWFAIRSKEALRKRLLELEKLAQNTKRHINEPAILLIDLLRDAITFLSVSLVIFLVDVFIVLILFANGILDKYLVTVIVAVTIHFTSEIIRFLQSIREKINYFYNSSIITKEAEELIGGAKRLGLITDSEILTIQQMLEDKKLEDTHTSMVVGNS